MRSVAAAALAFSVDAAALLQRDIALRNSVEMYKYGNFVWNKMKMKNISPRRLRMNVTEGNMKFKCLVQSVHGIWIEGPQSFHNHGCQKLLLHF